MLTERDVVLVSGWGYSRSYWAYLDIVVGMAEAENVNVNVNAQDNVTVHDGGVMNPRHAFSGLNGQENLTNAHATVDVGGLLPVCAGAWDRNCTHCGCHAPVLGSLSGSYDRSLSCDVNILLAILVWIKSKASSTNQ